MTMESNNSSTPAVAPPSGSGLKTTKKPPGEIDLREYEEEDPQSEELNLGKAASFTLERRNFVFQKAVMFERSGKPDLALKCYLACIKGLNNNSCFTLLPECLKNIADIYQTKGDYENAIQFAQAEKLFYETTLIEAKRMEKEFEASAQGKVIKNNLTKRKTSTEANRADEYENLAHLCLENQQAQLALDYAGKCAKIRQDMYGSNHKQTRETLDFFASVYAQAGKEQYSNSAHQMNEYMETESSTDPLAPIPEVVMTGVDGVAPPVSILRHRLISDSDTDGDKKKQVRFHTSVDDCVRRKRREILHNLFILLAVIIVITIGYTLS